MQEVLADGQPIDRNELEQNLQQVTVHRLTASRRWTWYALKGVVGLCVGLYADWNMKVVPAVTAAVETSLVVAAYRKERDMSRKTGMIRCAAVASPCLLLDAAQSVGTSVYEAETRDGVLRLIDEALAYAEAENALRRRESEGEPRDAEGYPLLLRMDDDAIRHRDPDEPFVRTEFCDEESNLLEEYRLAALIRSERNESVRSGEIRGQIVDAFVLARRARGQANRRSTFDGMREAECDELLRHYNALVRIYAACMASPDVPELGQKQRRVEEEYLRETESGVINPHVLSHLEAECELLAARKARTPYSSDVCATHAELTRHITVMEHMASDAFRRRNQVAA